MAFQTGSDKIKQQHGVKVSSWPGMQTVKSLFAVLMNFLLLSYHSKWTNPFTVLLYYFFKLTKLERNVRKIWPSRWNQTPLHDVFIIQPKLAVRHYDKIQKRNHAKCNMPSSEASLHTNQSFVCVQTECLCYCAIVPMSACSHIHLGLWTDNLSSANLYRISAQVRSVSLRAISVVPCIHQTSLNLNPDEHFVLLRYLGLS
jgi:hypothetical protein